MTATRTLGIPTLDRALMDGVPAGFTVLVSGNAGSGVELFVKQVAAAGDEPTVYFTTDETGEEVLDTMARFGWSKEIHVEDISSRFHDRIVEGKLAPDRRRREDTPISELLGETSRDRPENFLTLTASRIADLDGPARVIVQNLNFFFEEHDPDEVLSVLRTLRTTNRHEGGLLVLALSRDAVADRVAHRVEAGVDMVIDLEMDRMASSFEHRIILKKVMNRPDKAQMFVYGVTDEGITPEMVTRVA